MNLFGCKFCKNPINGMDQTKRCERKNFDSLLWALVTVFQVFFTVTFVIFIFMIKRCIENFGKFLKKGRTLVYRKLFFCIIANLQNIR